jgi:hypothetical protein
MVERAQSAQNFEKAALAWSKTGVDRGGSLLTLLLR